jgi:hypothetical protein
MRIRFVALAALLISALVVAPATAATDQRHDIWVGQIVRHHHHFDYRGSACPTSAEVCIKILANYRIVPLTPRAAARLRRAAGGRAKLVGYLTPTPNARHNGVLFVRRVEKA